MVTQCLIQQNIAQKKRFKNKEEHDPIDQVKNRILQRGFANEDDLKSIDKEVRAIVADAADFAQSNQEPDASELYTDVLV